MTPELVGLLAYVGLQVGIGLTVTRRIRTEADYLLAGRRLGPWLATASVFATWFGAETCIGAAGAIYASGLSGASADPFGYGGCLLLLGLVYAAPLHRLGITTLADLFRLRFGVGVERLAALLMVPTSVFWAAAQVRAFGSVLTVTAGWSDAVAVTFAAATAIAYTAAGGLLADAITDAVQGLALAIGLGVLAVVVVGLVGDPVTLLATEPPERVAIVAGGGWTTLEAWALPVCGSVLAQELVGRMLGARSAGVARGAALGGGVMYVAVGLVPVFLGLAGARLVPGLDDPEEILPRLAREHLGTVGFVLFAGALTSAILSTVDSALLAAGAIVEHNLVVPVRPGLTDAERLRIARAAVVGAGVVAWALALTVDGVFTLVEEASAFGSAGLFVVASAGLFTRFGGPSAACAGLLTGLVTWVVGAHLLGWTTPYLASLGAAAAAYAGVGVAEGRAQGR
jgi:Na+/proline symporter